MSNLIFDVTLSIKINYPTYSHTPPKPAVILLLSTIDDLTLELVSTKVNARYSSSPSDVFRKYAANLQENTHAKVRFQ